MKATQVSKENGVVKFNIEFSAEEFKDALSKAYLANRGKFQIDGFRKGKAPRKVIESHYGHDVFWDEALNGLLSTGYYDALRDMDLEVIAQPSLESPEIKEGEPVVISGSVQVFPEMEVESYKGLEIEKVETKIGEKEVKAELERVQKSQARMETVEDRKTETGEEFDVNVKFPEDYHAEELKGKDAVFKCKLHEIKKEILPEIDDELASDVSEFETLDEYKADLQKKLQENADARDESLMKDRALEKLYEANEIEVPEGMIRNEIDNIIYDMNQNLATQGLGLQQYMEWTGKTIDDVREEAKPEAEKRVRTRILLKNLIRQENLEADAAEIENLMKEFGEQYGMTVDQVKEMAGAETENYFKEDAQTKKAIDFLFENAVLTEKKEEAEEK